MKISSPQAFFFDFDGVIVDSEQLHMVAARAASQTYGITFTRDYYYQILLGFDDIGLFKHLWQDQCGQELSEHTLQDLMEKKSIAFMDALRTHLVFFDGVIDLIKKLHNTPIPLAVVSGARKKEIEVCLAAAKITDHFLTIVSADDVKKSKPDPEPYQNAFFILQKNYPTLQQNQCWAIEDSPAGITSAKKSGMNVIGITHSVSRDMLNEADAIIDRFEELVIDTHRVK